MRNRFFDPSFGKALPCENTIQKTNRTWFPNALRGQIRASARKPRVLEEPKGSRTPSIAIRLRQCPLRSLNWGGALVQMDPKSGHAEEFRDGPGEYSACPRSRPCTCWSGSIAGICHLRRKRASQERGLKKKEASAKDFKAVLWESPDQQHIRKEPDVVFLQAHLDHHCT